MDVALRCVFLCLLVLHFLIPVVVNADDVLDRTSKDTVILVTDWSNPGRILNVSLRNMNFTTVQSQTPLRPVAIDFDTERQTLYWTDVFKHQISSTDVRGGHQIVLTQLTNLSTPDGLAVDGQEGVLFYTDAGRNVVVKLSLEDFHSEIIVEEHLYEPRAIVTYTKKRQIYWTDWGVVPRIERANYDGTDRTTLLSTGLVWPNGLTIDPYNDRLFWCDAKMSRIESADMDGSDRQIVLQELGAHYFDIFYHKGLLFFTDWARKQSLLHVPVCGGQVGYLKSDGFRHLAGLHVVSVDNADEDLQYIVPECKDRCSRCKDVSKCDAGTGRCSGGCVDGWTGSNCNTVVKQVPTLTTYFIANMVTSAPTNDIMESLNDTENQELFTHMLDPIATPAATRERTEGGAINIGLATYVGLGVLTFLLLIATTSLAAIYINRRRKSKEAYNNLADVRPHQSFSNNTYTLMTGSDAVDRGGVYLVPLSDPPKEYEDDADHFYEDIFELKK